MINSLQHRRVQIDILRVPVLGRFLTWKHSRTAVQVVLFALAAVIVVDGLVGSQLAPKNVATVAAWVHYRGLVALALLVAGNLFCAGCPFVLPRKLAKWIGRPTRRWPKLLRNKWLALLGFVGIIYCYELFDLWASPWLTAWLTIAYFATAFVLELFFTRDSFCLYVCPLGTFNFLYSTVSPLHISSRNLKTCRDCKGHECINGSATQQGCQLELFVPTMQSNLDCTLCLDCVKACPYDNVALAIRPPGDELFRQSWPHRLDLALLAILAAFLGTLNAFGMTPPVYTLETQLAAWLVTTHEAIVLGLIYLVGGVLWPLLLIYSAAWLSKSLVASSRSVNRLITRYAYGFVPVGFAIWLAHYLFHFLTGILTIIPAFQTFFAETLQWPLLGDPNWELARRFVPTVSTIQLLQTGIIYLGLLTALALTLKSARKAQPKRWKALLEAAPWIVLLFLLVIGSGMIFLLPMEMRGSALGG